MPSTTPMRGLRMEDDLYLKLKEIAKRENRSYNQEAIHILTKFVEDYEKEKGIIPVDVDGLYE